MTKMSGIYFKITWGGESQWRHIKYVTQNWPIVYIINFSICLEFHIIKGLN